MSIIFLHSVSLTIPTSHHTTYILTICHPHYTIHYTPHTTRHTTHHTTRHTTYYTTHYTPHTTQHTTHYTPHTALHTTYYTTHHTPHTTQHITHHILHNTLYATYYTHPLHTHQPSKRRLTPAGAKMGSTRTLTGASSVNISRVASDLWYVCMRTR
jgi:hypothetical protein